MENEQKKDFSVVVRLNHFDGLNGELSGLVNPQERKEYLEQYFLKRYGHGGGKLSILQKESKVKLIWLQPKFEIEAEKSHKEALAFAKEKNFREAINRWVHSIALNPEDPDYYFNLGIAFFEIKNFKESIENLNRSLSLCPIYYKAHLILGTVYLKVRRFEQAEVQLKESLIFFPNHALAYLNLGAVYSILKRYNEGIEMFLKTIELAPTEVRAHFGIAKIYSLTGEVEKANQYYKKVIEINTNQQLTNHAKRALVAAPLQDQVQVDDNIDVKNIEDYYQKGYSSYLYGDYEKAIEMYAVYVRKKPEDDFVWYSLGEAYLRSGQPVKAVESLQRAVAKNQNKALYYKALAIAHSYLNQESDAISAIQKAIDLGKSDSVSLTIWGKILIQQGNYSAAVEKLQQATKLNSNNLLAKYNLALANSKVNQNETAIIYLQDIIRAPIDSPVKIDAESLLRTLT